MKIYEIPDKLIVEWEPSVRAIVDTWTNQFITFEEFKEAIYIKGINHAKENGGRAWIVNSKKANSVFRSEIQDFIGSDVFPMFAKIGILYLITISPEDIIANISVEKYKAKTVYSGIKQVECESTEAAIEWLKRDV